MNPIIILICLLSNVFAFPGQDDEVIILPGLHFQPTFKHYSGYLNGSDTRKLHYWFFESQKFPKTDPLVLWLNGGPGCSSLGGALKGNGPFRLIPEGYLKYNEYSWNKVANVIYLESPSCVGFSYSTDGNCDATDDSTSLLNFNALKHFLVKFPQFKNRDFYITGESYAGFYIPILSERIAFSKDGLPVNFKGIAIGNAYSSVSINEIGNFNFAYRHGLISEKLWTKMISVCCEGQSSRNCDFSGKKNPACLKMIKAVSNGFGKLNPYNIYADCSYSSSIDDELWSHLGVISNYEKLKILYRWTNDSYNSISKLHQLYKIMSVDLDDTEQTDVNRIPCINVTDITFYLNKPRVKYALHIPDDIPSWTVCSEAPTFLYQMIYENMTNQYKNLFKLKDFKIWIYNGDIDMVCSNLAGEWFFESLNQRVVYEKMPWIYTVDNSHQVGGYIKILDKVVLLTIRGAGHMVPFDKPLQAYYMFASFINKCPIQEKSDNHVFFC